MRLVHALAIAALAFGSAWSLIAIPLAVFQQNSAIDVGAFQAYGWIPAAVVGILAFRAADQSFQPGARRHRTGYCGQCGYSLRGNVSGVCPECGMSVEP
jgi:hypothetical protein